MNKILLTVITLVGLVTANPVFAVGYVNKNTVVCMSLENIRDYTNGIKNNEKGFVQDLLDRADCFSKIKPIKAIRLSTVGNFVSVKTLNNFVIWLPISDFTEETIEKKVNNP